MKPFVKLFGSILSSSIWNEDDGTRIVFMTMLVMADRHGEVFASVGGLAHQARVPLDTCQRALAKLESPDNDSRTPDNEGRRIQKIEGGWLILNYLKYRELGRAEDRREYFAEHKRQTRKRSVAGQPDGQMSTLVHTCPPKSPIAEAEAEAEAEKTKSKSAPVAHPPTKPKFEKPTIEAMRLYAAKLGLPESEADRCFDHYEANGWTTGPGKPVRDWQASMRNWRRNWQEGKYGNRYGNNPNPTENKRNVGMCRNPANDYGAHHRRLQEQQKAALAGQVDRPGNGAPPKAG